MQRGDELEVTVDRLAYGGDGIGSAPDGRVVFVRGAAPGARVKVKVTQARKKFLRGEIFEVVEAAGVEPFCPHVDTCGGCPWQRVAIEDQREVLRAHLSRALSYASGTTVEAEAAADIANRAWRSTARVHWQNGKLGFHARASRDVIAIDACPVFADPLNALLAAAHETLGDALTGRGTIRLSAAPGAASGTVSVHPEGNQGRKRMLIAVRELLKKPVCHGAVVVWPDGRHDWEGQTENVLGSAKVVHPANAFVQAHQPGMDLLVADVVESLKGAESVLEWYAGAGNFTLALIEAGLSVTPVEQAPAAAAALHDRVPTTIVGDAVKVSTKGYPAVLLDPPRAGAAGPLGRLAPSVRTLVYVSCDFGTLGRDVAALSKTGWKVDRARLYDLFPHTGRGEALVVLRR